MMDLLSIKRCKIVAVILCVMLVVGLVCCSRTDAPTNETVKGTITYENLAVHKKTDSASRVRGQLPLGFEVEILEQKTVDETVWGRIDKTYLPDGKKVKEGWINLKYVQIGDSADTNDEPPVVEPEIIIPEEPAQQPETVPVNVNMGTVTAGELNIRKGADSGYEVVGTYLKGARVEILETKTVEGTLWGRTNLGWVGMGYVRMDGTAAPVTEDNSALKIISDGNTNVLGYGIVKLGELNVRQGPDTKYPKVSTITMANRYAYYQLENGWARMEDGWVSTDYFYIEGTTTSEAFTGAITMDDVNIRTGPNTSFQSIATYKKGDIVTILAQVDAWGYTDKGWVFITYVEPVQPTYTTGACRVTSGLNIRAEANAESEIVGTYTEGDFITVIEVDGSWGKTDKGWINLKYVEYS